MPSPTPPSTFGQAALITALKGQTLRIPSLQALFHTWPSPSLNAHYQELVPLASAAILEIAAAAPQLSIERRLRDDIALLTCLLFPTARRNQIEALVLYMVWLVCWDDTVDTNEGDLAADFAGAEEWRGKTLEIARTALQLPDDGGAQHGAAVDAINAVLVNFGQRYCYGTTHERAPLEQRQRLYDEISIFIRACAMEQRLRLDNALPSFEEYMDLREGTVAGGTLCALVPFAMGRHVPPELLDSPQFGVLRKQANVLFGLLNDLISLKKELSMDCVINAVCTLLRPETPLDEVMAQIYQKLQDAVRLFNEAAGELIDQCMNNNLLYDLSKDLVDGYRSVVTGTLEFMLKSPRYNISQLLREDGSLEIVL
ncbi:uncharacterized protein TrAFT101_003964 [Trichoderma asperellum]|uniref:uncharacterized protein n=1 Tax=Trichoderma asperellum TaxID=101201 RepID=UPI0033282F26|nr:hypothetical protein TrAFT101_003964 [Trichoderma asperellum]